MPVITSMPDLLVIRKPRLGRPFLAFLVLWLLVQPFLLWPPSGERVFVSLMLLALFGAMALLTLGGVRIVATAQGLEMHGLFWRLWHVDLDRLVISQGDVGEDIRFHAYIVRDGQHHAGAIVKKDFEAESLQQLFTFLAANGAKLDETAPRSSRP